jgi:hypothetical protein
VIVIDQPKRNLSTVDELAPRTTSVVGKLKPRPMSSIRSQPQIIAIKAPLTKTPLSSKGIKTIVIPEGAIERIPVKKPKMTVTKVVKANLASKKTVRPTTAVPLLKSSQVSRV